jgi:hypothetical protein
MLVIGTLLAVRRSPDPFRRPPEGLPPPVALRASRGWWGNAPHDDPEIAFLRIREIKRLWREACEAGRLGQWIAAPSGPWRAFPLIERVVLGNPTTITVRLRSGQLPSDVEAEAARIAYTMGAGGLRISETSVPMLLRIEFMDQPAERVEGEIIRLPLDRPESGPLLEGPDDEVA